MSSVAPQRQSTGETCRAPDFLEPILGWRVWLVAVREGRARLRSVAHDLLWPPGQPVVAECRLPQSGLLCMTARWDRHHAPHVPCACGLYAARGLLDCARYLSGRLPPGSTLACGLGQVALWGDVVECEHGWRAARAYPERLYVFITRGGEAARLEDLAGRLGEYEVPVRAVEASSVAGVVSAIRRLETHRGDGSAQSPPAT